MDRLVTEVITNCVGLGGLDGGGLDIALAQDVSQSMNDPAGPGSPQTRLAAAQQAASTFVGLLTVTDRVAVVPYSNTASLALPLTTTKGIVTGTIFALTTTGFGFTNIGDGIGLSHWELITSPRHVSGTAKVIILLSDGRATLPVDEPTAKAYALAKAQAAAADNIRIYTIGFGDDTDQVLLQEVADISDGQYFFAPDSSTLATIFVSLGVRRGCTYLPLVSRNWLEPGIFNGGFEWGWSGWAHGGELAQTVVATPVYSGGSSALLGNAGYVCQNGVPVGSAWLEQSPVVPNTLTPTLVFRYRIFTQDLNSFLTDQYDSFDVRVNGVLRFRDAKLAGAYGCGPQALADLGWRLGQIDLSAVRGQPISLRFENRSQPDGWYNTWTFIDEVRIAP